MVYGIAVVIYISFYKISFFLLNRLAGKE